MVGNVISLSETLQYFETENGTITHLFVQFDNEHVGRQAKSKTPRKFADAVPISKISVTFSHPGRKNLQVIIECDKSYGKHIP